MTLTWGCPLSLFFFFFSLHKICSLLYFHIWPCPFYIMLLLFLSHHDFFSKIFTYRFSLSSMWWLLCIISKGFSLQKCSKLLLPLFYLLACKLLLFSFFNIFTVWQNTILISISFALFIPQGSVLCSDSSTCSIGSFKSDNGLEWTKFESAWPVST